MKYNYVSKNFEETMETNNKASKSTTMVEEKSSKPNLCLLNWNLILPTGSLMIGKPVSYSVTKSYVSFIFLITYKNISDKYSIFWCSSDLIC